MSPAAGIDWILRARRALIAPVEASREKQEAEGGCGVIGMASSVKVPGRSLLQALAQMWNRGNGKGGGIAAIGLEPAQFGVTQEVLDRDYLLCIGYLDPAVRAEVEREHVHALFDVDHIRVQPRLPDHRSLRGVDVAPPEAVQYFVRVKPEAVDSFVQAHGASRPLPPGLTREQLEDELVYQNSYRLNKTYYASTGEKRAFVLSHGKNQLVLKMVGYGDDVVRYYRLEDLRAHVWIGHHRYPTKGKVWHPGGAHPFVGLHEALVHNGDFANYASMTEYLAQRNIYPLFLTDTEVSVLVFDLLHRTYQYPLEAVIESLAPTTERDFNLLPEPKQRLYQALQSVHMHGSPDGPWFFLIAQSDVRSKTGPHYRLLGITDTSMLRPQVFALQQGPQASVGLAASEKQAIDAALETLAREDKRFWSRADLYWNARGGSHTDGGAFLFTVTPKPGGAELVCTDKFGRRVEVPDPDRPVPASAATAAHGRADSLDPLDLDAVLRHLPTWSYEDIRSYLDVLVKAARGRDLQRHPQILEILTHLIDRRYPTGNLRRSRLLSFYDEAFAELVETMRTASGGPYVYTSKEHPTRAPADVQRTLVIDSRGLPAEGPDSLAMEIVRRHQQGWRKFLLAHAKGQRFIGNGLGPQTNDVRIDVYGSPGDYLASGIDGLEILVHNSAQDQLAQIMKYGGLVVHGDVGQTFMYGAKGGTAYVLGSAAGRPLINAVGRPRVVINGTCLDYLAESFMAGDPLKGGGFVVLNGIRFDEAGRLADLPTPYPGGNLFSLASGGAIYLRDPRNLVGEEQLNGGAFVPFTGPDWDLVRPHLEENEQTFGIPVARLLEVDGATREPSRVYRKIRPGAVHALQAEEAWVKKEV